MKKLVFFSPIASPHQVRFCEYLRKYYDAEFYFYERSTGRQKFWEVPLGEHCHILPTRFRWHRRYCTLSVLKVLQRNKPDIVMFGGFSVPSNYFAYLWAKRHGAKTVVQTERSRVIATGVARSYDWKWRLIHWLYKDIDCVMTISSDIVPQFRDTFHFGDKVVAGQYPADIDRYYVHPIRGKKDSYTLIFANRQTDIYNPIGAVEIFSEVLKRYPQTKLLMNASGELRPKVETRIAELGIGASVEFLDNIKHWDDISEVYRRSDIMYLPAKYSNGNYTLTECRASGMGCIVSDCVLGSGVDQMRTNGAGAVLPLDNHAFAEKIIWYIEHPEQFAIDAAINRQDLQSRTFSGTAKLYAQLIEALYD